MCQLLWKPNPVAQSKLRAILVIALTEVRLPSTRRPVSLISTILTAQVKVVSVKLLCATDSLRLTKHTLWIEVRAPSSWRNLVLLLAAQSLSSRSKKFSQKPHGRSMPPSIKAPPKKRLNLYLVKHYGPFLISVRLSACYRSTLISFLTPMLQSVLPVTSSRPARSRIRRMLVK